MEAIPVRVIALRLASSACRRAQIHEWPTVTGACAPAGRIRFPVVRGNRRRARLKRSALAGVTALQTQANEIGDGADAQLGQQSCLVHLDGTRADVERVGNFAVVPTGDDFFHHFLFAWRQGRQQARAFTLAKAVFLRRALATEGLADRPQELVMVDRLLEEVDRLRAETPAAPFRRHRGRSSRSPAASSHFPADASAG